MVQAAHILVGGGTGFVGRHLVKCLRDGGAKVKIITRHPRKGDPNQISWNTIKSDGLPKETTAVVNLSGRNILDPVLWTESFKKEVYESRIGTNRMLADAIHRAANKPNAFVTVSGVGYYPASETVEYDENWTQPDDTSRCNYVMRLARDWEKASELNESEAPNTRRVVVRAGAVIGHDGGIIKNTKLPYILGAGGPLGDGKQWFPWIHVDDLASMFKFAIANTHVSGIINGVAPEQSRNLDYAVAFGKALRRPHFVALPEFVVNLMFSAERADILLRTPRVRSRASLLGFRYQYPNLVDACKEAATS